MHTSVSSSISVLLFPSLTKSVTDCLREIQLIPCTLLSATNVYYHVSIELEGTCQSVNHIFIISFGEYPTKRSTFHSKNISYKENSSKSFEQQVEEHSPSFSTKSKITWPRWVWPLTSTDFETFKSVTKIFSIQVRLAVSDANILKSVYQLFSKCSDFWLRSNLLSTGNKTSGRPSQVLRTNSSEEL